MTFPVTAFEIERRKRLISRWTLASTTGIYPSRLALIERGQVKPWDREVELISGALGIPVKKVITLIQAGNIE